MEVPEGQKLCDLGQIVGLGHEMPILKSIESWRAFTRVGNRQFSEHEMALLKRTVDRITNTFTKSLVSDYLFQYGHSANTLRGFHRRSHKTPARAAEKIHSLEKFKVGQAAAVLHAARQNLNKRLQDDPKMRDCIRKRRQHNHVTKNFDYSKHLLPRGKKEGPMRPDLTAKISSKVTGVGPTSHESQKAIHIAATTFDDIYVSSPFVATSYGPETALGLLRKDPKLRKFVVQPGKETPLRQCVSRLSDLEHEILLLKERIAELERKNLNLQRSRKTPPRPRSELSHKHL